LPVAPNNGDHHFSKLFNVEETKGIIHSRIIPARDVTQSVSYIISALISYNVIIKKYVNRKITSYIYLLIFTQLSQLHVKHFIALSNEKGRCENICFVYLPIMTTLVHTTIDRSVTSKNTLKLTVI
jgi:hypothetical protein